MLSKFNVKNVSVLCLGLALVGCGKDNDPVQAVRNEVQEVRQQAEIDGKWRTNCARSALLKAPVMESWEFGGGAFTQTLVLSAGRTCAKSLAEIKSSGTFEVQAIEGVDQVTDLNLHYTQVQVTPSDEAGAALLNARNFCGKGDWKMGEVRIVNGGATENCFVSQLPGDTFGAVEVDDGANEMFLSDVFVEKDTERSRSIERSKTFSKFE